MRTAPNEVFAIEGITDGVDQDGNFTRVFWNWAPEDPGHHDVRIRDVVNQVPHQQIRSWVKRPMDGRVEFFVCGKHIEVPADYLDVHVDLVDEQIEKMSRGITWSNDD